MSCLDGCDTRFVAAVLGQDGPGNTRKLVGQGGDKDVAMQSLRRVRNPRPKPMLGPTRRMQKNGPGTQNEKRAQVGVAVFGDATEDRSVPCRHLLGHKAKPRRELTPVLEGASVGREGGLNHGTRRRFLRYRRGIGRGGGKPRRRHLRRRRPLLRAMPIVRTLVPSSTRWSPITALTYARCGASLARCAISNRSSTRCRGRRLSRRNGTNMRRSF